MMQQLRALTERVSASAAPVVDAGLARFGRVFNGTAINGTTFGCNVMPSVHAPAICTHGKRYERRLQEMLT